MEYREFHLLDADGKGLLDLYRHDIVNANGDPYMERWVTPQPDGGTHRVHHILRSDDDRFCHDHPWHFTSLILTGRYVEHTPVDPAVPWGPTVTREFGPGDVNVKRATDVHRLELREGPVWTLVVSGPKHRHWGFWLPTGWVHWQEFEKMRGVDNNGAKPLWKPSESP